MGVFNFSNCLSKLFKFLYSGKQSNVSELKSYKNRISNQNGFVTFMGDMYSRYLCYAGIGILTGACGILLILYFWAISIQLVKYV